MLSNTSAVLVAFMLFTCGCGETDVPISSDGGIDFCPSDPTACDFLDAPCPCGQICNPDESDAGCHLPPAQIAPSCSSDEECDLDAGQFCRLRKLGLDAQCECPLNRNCAGLTCLLKACDPKCTSNGDCDPGLVCTMGRCADPIAWEPDPQISCAQGRSMRYTPHGALVLLTLAVACSRLWRRHRLRKYIPR